MGRYNRTLRERLVGRLVANEAGCLEWTGCRQKFGYGSMGVGGCGKTELTHRVAWQLERGPIPEGMCVLHRCDNPPCCNVDHLFLGTRTDNNADMVAKHRNSAAPGLRNGSAKVTCEQADAILRRYREGRETQDEIAAAFGIGQAAVSDIVNGRHWTQRAA